MKYFNAVKIQEIEEFSTNDLYQWIQDYVKAVIAKMDFIM